MPKRVLLTGGGGGVGIHVLSRILATTDWTVVILDSFRHKGYLDRVTELLKGSPEWHRRLWVIQHDLNAPISENLRQDIGPIDYILHLAAMSDVTFSIDNAAYVIRNNIESTLTMLEYAKRTPHEAFIYFSTDEVYGPVKKGGVHNEWETHRPSNAYSASKAACEDICYAYWRKGDIRLVITNTMNNFGEMQSASKFPAMVQKRLQNGEKVTIHGTDKELGTRYYIHSAEVADALIHICKHLPPYRHLQGHLDDPDRYHIVGDDCVDNLEMARTIAGIMKKPLDYELVDFHKDNPAHDIHYGLKDNKLRKSGWKPKRTFKKSLGDTIKWQQEHNEWL